MKLVEKWTAATYHEIGQRINNRLGFLQHKGDHVLLEHMPVYCRDFLNDTLVWRDKGETAPAKIYGFSYAGGVDTDATRMLIQAPPKASNNLDMGNYEKYVHLLNDLEVAAGYSPTKITKLDSPVVSYMAEGDPAWMDNTVSFSFYTALLRYLGVGWAKPEPPKTMEELITEAPEDEVACNLQKHGASKLAAAIKTLPKKEVMGSVTTSGMHNYNGFCTALNLYTGSANRYGVVLTKALGLKGK